MKGETDCELDDGIIAIRNLLILITVLWFCERIPCFFRKQTLKDLGVKGIMSTAYSQTA